MKTITAVSAGGVLFRRINGGGNGEPSYEVVLVGQSRSGRWGLPKGGPAPDETLEDAALREVREETGVEGRIVAGLGHIQYWFGARGLRYRKTVHFYLMAAVGGDVSRHDLEHDVVDWFPVPQAIQSMSYANEKEIVRRAEQALRNLGAT